MRLRFISNLPLVAWIGMPPEGGVGTVVTLFAEEIAAATAMPSASALAIRDYARRRLLHVGKGTDLLGVAPEHWLELRPAFAAQAEKERQVAAFTRLHTIDIAKVPVAEMLNGRLREGHKLRRQLEIMAGSFAADIANRADPRITHPKVMAADFMRSVERMAQPTPATAAELILRGLATQGVTATDLKPDSTIGEMLELGLFRCMLKVMADETGLPYSETLRNIRSEQLPAWTIAKALERHLPDLPVHEGGEITDIHLACLAAYADLTLVDKRTLEGVRRLRSKEPKVAQLLGRIERLARFEQIPSVLAE
jgi:hypothetical protein